MSRHTRNHPEHASGKFHRSLTVEGYFSYWIGMASAFPSDDRRDESIIRGPTHSPEWKRPRAEELGRRLRVVRDHLAGQIHKAVTTRLERERPEWAARLPSAQAEVAKHHQREAARQAPSAARAGPSAHDPRGAA